MKLARMTEFHKMTIEEADMPELKEGEALIRIKYFGICGSDVHIFEGKHPTAVPPMVLGHEFCGYLHDIKSGKIKSYAKGDFVTAHPLTSCGYCEHCLGGRQNLCKDIAIFGVHKDGCYAEYIKVSAERLVKINPEIEPETAALLEPLAVAVHDVRRSGLRVGESVFIIGAGTIGLMIALVAELNGAGNIIMSEIDEKRIKFARSMGFTVINPYGDGYDAQVAELSGGNGFDRVFEVSGTQNGWDCMTKACKSGGTIVPIGIPNQGFQVDVVSVVLREIELKGVRIHPFNNFKAAVDIISSGLINDKLKKLVSRVYDLDDVNKAFSDVIEDKTIIKAIVKCS